MKNTFGGNGRVKIVEMDMTLLTGICTPDLRTRKPVVTCKKGLPEGADLIHWAWRVLGNMRPTLILLYEHPSWDVVPANEEIPLVSVVFEQTWPDA